MSDIGLNVEKSKVSVATLSQTFIPTKKINYDSEN